MKKNSENGIAGRHETPRFESGGLVQTSERVEGKRGRRLQPRLQA